MASTGDPTSKPTCSFMQSIGFDVSKNPATLAGATSYGLLSLNMFNPELLNKVAPSRDLTNVIMAGTLAGGSFFLYNRPHLASLANKKQRILLSVYGSSMITLGSLLFWAMLRVLVPDNTAARSLVAVGSSLVLLKTGQTYLQVVDDFGKKTN